MRKTLPIFFPLFLALFAGGQSVEPSQCIAPLGMESGLIKDEDIIASSSFNREEVGPQHGRIRNELNGGAWCAKGQATPETQEWIEVNLRSVHMVTATETQGRFGNGQGEEFAESYVLEYFRPTLNKWVGYRTKSSTHLLKGNVNTYTEEKTTLDPPLWASHIRFLPYSSHKRTVCMRVEVYGCLWSDGILSYDMPQGDKRGSSWEFYDFAYDGHWNWNDNVLMTGLGQLVDGKTAPDDFKLPFHQQDLQGWIGWKNDTRNTQPIEIVFEFDHLREFRAMHIFCNNQFTREVQVFSVAKVFFSADGKRYRGEPIQYDYMEDRIFEDARNVSIKLHRRLGRFVKLQLHFAARWMLVSEVSFESSLASGNFSLEDDDDEIFSLNVSDNNDNDSDGFGYYVGIIVAILVVLILIMVVTVMYVLVRQDSQKQCQIAGNGALYGVPTESLPDVRDLEHAVALQAIYTSPKQSSSEQYYATVDICKPDFIPPPPPRSSPRPNTRLKRFPGFIVDNAYVGP